MRRRWRRRLLQLWLLMVVLRWRLSLLLQLLLSASSGAGDWCSLWVELWGSLWGWEVLPVLALHADGGPVAQHVLDVCSSTLELSLRCVHHEVEGLQAKLCVQSNEAPGLQLQGHRDTKCMVETIDLLHLHGWLHCLQPQRLPAQQPPPAWPQGCPRSHGTLSWPAPPAQLRVSPQGPMTS